jgi:hypothetical protein
LENEVVPLVEHVIDSRAVDWESAVDRLATTLEFRSAEDLRAVRHNLRDWLAQSTLAVLSAEAVADLAHPDLLLKARGPWLAAVNPAIGLPGRAWSAGPRVIRAVRRQLRPLEVQQWSEVVSAHVRARDHAGGDTAYNDLCWRLYLLYFTTAAGVPWSKLVDLPAGREARHLLFPVKEWSGVVEWASCLAALLTHRALFAVEEVATFVEPVRGLMPDLERVVNTVR